VLEKITFTEKPKLPFPIKDDVTLAGLLEMGQNDQERAWPIFQVFWKELTKANSSIDGKALGERPPVLLCLDNMAHVMVNSKYQVLNEAGKLSPVHALDLAIVKHFFDLISGTTSLPNGGMILAATSASDAPRSEAMEVGIAIAETKQNSDSPTPTPYTSPYTKIQKLSPTRDANPAALSNFWSPFKPIDTRVLSTFTTAPAGSPEIVRLQGLSQQESVSLMKYWTRSGMNMGSVLPWTVQEVRALSGGAVVGQLEQTVVRFLQRQGKAVENEAGGKKIRVH
jgi:small subunit ribosomal protein S29